MDPSVKTFITGSLESLVNTALSYDPASRQELANLTDILAIESNSPDFTLYCHGSEDGIRLMCHCEVPATTQLSGSALALLSLLKQPSSLANSGVELSGSVGLLQQWQALLHNLDIDWEDAISGIIGDITGPMLASKLRKGAEWAQNQKEVQLRLLQEYLPEELKIIPSKTELALFSQDISQLVLDTDRLDAKFKYLGEALNKKEQVEKGRAE
ncbi:MAG: ubiquinone biosynthesis protein UbiJ [Cellvibrionaceae bacterium]|jgi:ubiquinone biosynthesis protein UbiJ